MAGYIGQFKAATAAMLMAGVLSTAAQDLVAVSSLGSSSIFVFRSSRSSGPRVSARPSRSKAQKLESVAKIRKQYVAIAKAKPDPNRAKIVDPNKLGPRGGHELPPAQASKLFTGVGEYYVDKGQFDQSLQFFRDAINLDANNQAAKLGLSEALALKGNDMLVKEQGQSAKALFLEAIKYNPRNSAAYFGLGEVYSDADDQAQAITAYEKSLQNDKDLTEIYVPLGILYYQAGEIAKADDLLTKALASSPNNAETQYFLGLVRSSQSNRTDEALAAFRKAASIDPNYADAFFSTGEMLMRQKKASEAIPEYEKALSLKPNYLDAMIGLGQAYNEAGNYPKAIEKLAAAAKIKNDNWETFASLADAYRSNGEFNNAIGYYNNATLFLTRQASFNKDTAADLYGKAGYSIGRQCELNMARFIKCQWPSAVANMEKAVELSGSPLDYANLGWAYYNAARADFDAKDTAAGQAKLELAKTALLKAIAGGNPIVSEGAYQNLGGVQIDLGDYTGAIDSLNRVVDKHPDWTFSRYALGTAYFKTGDFNKAASWFQKVVDAEPKYVPALSSLGYTQIKLKNGSEVKRIIERLKPLDAGAALKLEQNMKLAKL